MKSRLFSSALLAGGLSLICSLGMTACSDSGSDSSNAPIISPDDPQNTDNPPVNTEDTLTPIIPQDTSETPTPIIPPADTSVTPVTPEDTIIPVDTSTTPETPVNPADTATPAEPPADTIPVVDPTPTTNDCADGQVPSPATFPMNDFVDIGEVYKAIQCNEKVVFIIRHGERDQRTGSSSRLTDYGVETSIAAGQKIAGPDTFKYVFSGMVRTYQTAMYIAYGRDPSIDTTQFVADTIKQLADGWFFKDSDLLQEFTTRDSIKNVNVAYSWWVYEGKYAEAFYDLDTKAKELINDYLVKDYAAMPKFTLAASHDQVLMPLTVWATGKEIDIKLHNTTGRKNWLNNLAGVAIIINDKNEQRYVAVKGDASGVE